MISEFRKFRGWVVLEHFLKNPYAQIHIKRLARELKIGNYSAQHYLAVLGKTGILNSKQTGNMKLYSLNNENFSVPALKEFYFLQRLNEMDFPKTFISENPSIITLVLYGSYADGTYAEKSDIDILAIATKEKIKQESLNKLELEFGKEVSISIYTFGEWRKLVRRRDNFALSVQKNNVALYGAGI